MSIEKHIFKTQESFLLKSNKDLDSVKLILIEAGVKLPGNEDQSNKEESNHVSAQENKAEEEPTRSKKQNRDFLSGSIKDNSFVISESSNFLFNAFIPNLVGKIESTESGTNISIISQPSWFMTILIQKLGAAFIGSILALVVSAFLLPNTISIFYAFALTIILPLVVFIATIFIARLTVPKSVTKIIESLKISFNAEEDSDSEHNFLSYIKQPPVSQNYIAGILASILFLAIALGLHAVAAAYWMSGKYDLSAQLCHPVASIAQAFLPNDSAAVADTNYYLAECLRCQGKLEEAKSLYTRVRKQYKQDIGEKHVYVADVDYALGRIFEEQGDLKTAKRMYSEALDIWSKDDRTKKSYISLARIKNRLAVVALKQQNPELAKKLLKKSLKWDKRYKKRSYGKVAMAEDSNDLAVAEYFSGDFESARKHLENSIKLKKKVYGVDSDELVASYINLAYVKAKLGSKKDAIKSLELASRILKVDLDAEKTIEQFVNTQAKDKSNIHPNFPEKLMEAFKKLVEKQNPAYESPQFAARANILLNLVGRL